jgi:hypothetical protein
MDTVYAIDTAKFLNIKATRIKNPIVVKGFDSKRRHTVTHILHCIDDGLCAPFRPKAARRPPPPIPLL